MGKFKSLLVIITISCIQSPIYAVPVSTSEGKSNFGARAKAVGNKIITTIKTGLEEISDTAKAGYYRAVEKSKYADKKGIDNYNIDRKTAVFKKISEIKNDQKYELNEKADQIFDKKATGSGIVKLKKLEKEINKNLREEKDKPYTDWLKENSSVDGIFKDSVKDTMPSSGAKVPFRQKIGQGLQKLAKKIEPEVISLTNPAYEKNSNNLSKNESQEKTSSFKKVGSAIANSRPITWVRSKIASGLTKIGTKVSNKKSGKVSFENGVFEGNENGDYSEPQYIELNDISKPSKNDGVYIKSGDLESHHYSVPQDAYLDVAPPSGTTHDSYLEVEPSSHTKKPNSESEPRTSGLGGGLSDSTTPGSKESISSENSLIKNAFDLPNLSGLLISPLNKNASIVRNTDSPVRSKSKKKTRQQFKEPEMVGDYEVIPGSDSPHPDSRVDQSNQAKPELKISTEHLFKSDQTNKLNEEIKKVQGNAYSQVNNELKDGLYREWLSERSGEEINQSINGFTYGTFKIDKNFGHKPIDRSQPSSYGDIYNGLNAQSLSSIGLKSKHYLQIENIIDAKKVGSISDKVNQKNAEGNLVDDFLNSFKNSPQQPVDPKAINKLSPQQLAPFNNSSTSRVPLVPRTVVNQPSNIPGGTNIRSSLPIQSPGFGASVGGVVRGFIKKTDNS